MGTDFNFDINNNLIGSVTYSRQTGFKTMDFHSHSILEIYVFAEGAVTYYIEESAYSLVPGDILVIPPEQMHRPVISCEDVNYERCIINISTDTLEKISTKDCNFTDVFSKKHLIRFSAEKQKSIFLQLFDASNMLKSGKPEKNMYVNAKILGFLTELLRAVKDGPEAMPPIKINSAVPDVIVYINSHLNEKINLDTLAARFFISKYHLLREFKKYTNFSIYDYIISKRITLSKKLIAGGTLLHDTAVLSGFADYSTFYKSFIKKTGISPKEYKNSIEKK